MISEQRGRAGRDNATSHMLLIYKPSFIKSFDFRLIYRKHGKHLQVGELRQLRILGGHGAGNEGQPMEGSRNKQRKVRAGPGAEAKACISCEQQRQTIC